MLIVTARIFDDNQLVGYLLTDGKVEKPVTREQAWGYAKNKMIKNVVAVGSANVQTPFGASNSTSLSGKNGFELKSLPKIEEVCNSNEIYEMKEELRDNGAGYTIEERELLIGVLIKIRKAMDKPKLDAMKNAIKEAVYNESDKFRSMSQYITVVATLYDSQMSKVTRYTVKKDIAGQLEKKKKEVYPIIGYRIKYTGSQPMIFTRSPEGKEYWPYDIELKNNEEYNLNLKEITMLAAKPEFDFAFSNGKVRQLSRKAYNLEEQLENYRVEFDDKVPELDIINWETEEEIYKVFGINIEQKNTPTQQQAIAKAYTEQLLAKMNGTEKKLKQANSPKGIFDSFKR